MLLILAGVFVFLAHADGLLYPKASETRDVRSLDGLWDFMPARRASDGWYKHNLAENYSSEVLHMPVPASYNDISTEAYLRDYVGEVWYDRTFYPPTAWKNSRVWLRFGSVHYSAQVWINGRFATEHQIGHLPFETEISTLLQYGQKNRVSVSCNNILGNTTIPQGYVLTNMTDEGKKSFQYYTFDFFNYAGIHRPVILYTTPKSYIEDVLVTTDVLSNGNGIISYNVTFKNSTTVDVGVKLYLKNDSFVASNSSSVGVLVVKNPKLWWPYLMNSDPGYLYTLEIQLLTPAGELIDVYRHKVGIRTLKWDNSTFLINDKPIYMHGFGRHEDSDIRGRGFDLPTLLRDYNLIKWIGGNAFRTSHYPYAEEVLDLADELGIMVIDECPAVNIDHVSPELLANHVEALKELISRDKNRPSVIAWSIANEPRSATEAAGKYFSVVANITKSLDSTRPLTASINVECNKDKLAPFLDIISFNRYNAWYRNEGRLDMIVNSVVEEAKTWRKKHNKPILMSEYGADTLEGLHFLPNYIWSEEYQVQLLSKHFEAFDLLRKEGWFVGEFIWNFADFKTSQKYVRVGGNKKGVFTRNRQPKAAAYHLRRRYFSLSHELHNANTPKDLNVYVVTASPILKDEL